MAKMKYFRGTGTGVIDHTPQIFYGRSFPDLLCRQPLLRDFSALSNWCMRLEGVGKSWDIFQ
jgi:hypothetical protein